MRRKKKSLCENDIITIIYLYFCLCFCDIYTSVDPKRQGTEVGKYISEGEKIKKMNILIAYFENLGNVVGGLEHAICDFSSEFAKRGHRVTIVTFDETQQSPYYLLDSRVSIVNLQKNEYLKLSRTEKLKREFYRLGGRATVRQWKFLWKRKHGVQAFSRVVKEICPDIIVSFETMTSREIYQEGIRVPLITSLRNDPRICCSNLPRSEMEAIKKSADILVLMPSLVGVAKDILGCSNIICIPNIVPQSTDTADLSRNKKKFKIVNVARLNKKQKRQEILIQAFASLAEKYPEWYVEFWGADTSEYKKELELMVKRYKLENRVFFRGVTKNVKEVYKSADIFAFPSKFEGFGQALGEAMSAGLPAVGFKSCSAVNELIKNGENGILAEDGVEAYAEALEDLMRNSAKRISMGKAAHESMKVYRPEEVWDQWEGLLQTVVSK